jgi:hypothetical protein
MWIIVKLIENENRVKMPVVILDSQHEVWEFPTELEAKKMKDIFQENSDSGHEYIIKKI